MRRLLVAAGMLVVLLGSLWLCRAPLLRAAANAWIIDEAPVPADAVLVLGGGLDTRPFAAADMYESGLAKRLLVVWTKEKPAEALGVVQPYWRLVKEVLLRRGVPESDIEVIGQGVSSTLDEAQALRDWTRAHKPSAILIPTDPFHTRRVNWWMSRALAEFDVDVRVQAVEVMDYSAKDWWKNEGGLIAFQNEVIKMIYYLVNYSGEPWNARDAPFDAAAADAAAEP